MAAESVKAADVKTTNSGMPVEFLRFQALEKESDYGENWLFFVQQKDGTNFYATLTITNVGFHTYDCYVNVGFAPVGKPFVKVHKEYRRDKLRASKDVFDVAIAANRAWGAPPTYHLKINEDGFKADIAFDAELPPYRVGNGKIPVPNTKKEYAYGINTPRAHATGSITTGGVTYAIDGLGFFDHEWQTAKVSNFSNGGFYVLLWHDDLTIILQDTFLKGNAGKKIQLGLVGKGNRIVAESQNYMMEIAKKGKDPDSGYEWPQTVKVEFAAGDVQVTGTLKTTAVIQNMDMLAELSWPIRVFVRTFVSNPWARRTWASYDLNVTIAGKRQHITGNTIPGALYY